MLSNLKKYQLILASNSPRRKELMSGLGVEYVVRTLPDVDESYPETLVGAAIPEYISRKKADAYRSMMKPGELLITADTIVWLEGKVLGKPEGREGRGAHRYSPYTNWQQVYEQLAEANPDYKQISVSDGSASVAVPRFGNQRGTDRYKFNPRNGEITETTLYKDLDNSGKIRGWIYSVHVGSWGGMLTRILTFVAALIGASLPLTGYYLWIRKKIKRRPASPKFLSAED